MSQPLAPLFFPFPWGAKKRGGERKRTLDSDTVVREKLWAEAAAASRAMLAKDFILEGIEKRS